MHTAVSARQVGEIEMVKYANPRPRVERLRVKRTMRIKSRRRQLWCFRKRPKGGEPCLYCILRMRVGLESIAILAILLIVRAAVDVMDWLT
jgi:hypothetical protein